MTKLGELKEKLLVIARLGSATAMLGWDQEVNLPPKAQVYRGDVQAQLAGELHKLSTGKKFVELITELRSPASMKSLSTDEQVIVREVWRDVEQAIKLPKEFVEEFTKLTSKAFSVWAEAREKSDFTIFHPVLEGIITMCRQQADFLGFEDSPYDALLDQYEPGLTSKKVVQLFMPLGIELAELIKHARANPPSLPKATYDLEVQKKLNYKVASDLGYDLEAGRIDTSLHPFTIGIHPSDVRITTRYNENDFWEALGCTIHETGHALYEQGLPFREFGTPLCEAVSLGVHESQSRIWENFVGKSRVFVDYLYPILSKSALSKQVAQYSPDELYAWLNRVQPNFIRVESDEVTYNLHIVLRFEIEKALMEGELEAKDIPTVWNQKMKQYLDLEVKDDALGCLQDIHWSHGTLGYFPTYTLGNLYAAQLYHKIKNDIPDLEKDFARGDFKPFLAWLRREIHAHGRRYQPEELLERATGEPLNPNYLIEHLKSKVS